MTEDLKRLGKTLTVNYAMIQSVIIMGYCSIFSFASVFLLSRGFTNSQVGLTLTLSCAAALFFQPLAAAFADQTRRFSLRSIVSFMLGLVSFFGLILYLTPAVFLPTAILYILLVLVFSTPVTLVTSMSMEHINKGVPINFSLARGIGSFAFAILSFLLGYLVEEFGAGVVMLVNIVLGFAGVILVSTFKKANKQNSSLTDSEDAAAGLLEFAQQNKRFLAVIASIALLFFSHVLINTYSIQIVENVGGSSADMGIGVAIAGLLELPAMAMFPLIYKKLQNAGLLMKIAAGFFIVKTLITLLAPNVFWFDVAQCFQFFAYAMFTPASVFYVNEVIRDADNNKGQAIMGMTMGISGLIANFFGGYILDTSGGVTMMLIIGILVSFAGFLMLIFIDKSKPFIRRVDQ